MRLLLDTHVFLWWKLDHPSLGEARDVIADPANEVLISAVVGWEIVIKRSLGWLEFAGTVAAAVAEEGFGSLGVELRHTDQLASLPALHADPFDRLLIAQAKEEGLTLVTADRAILQYPAVVLLGV